MQKDLDSAFEFCRSLAKSHYENFPVGSVLIPKDKRKYVYCIYAFARYADDIADSSGYDEVTKLQKLDTLESELDRSVNENKTDLNSDTGKIFLALSETIRNLNIPVSEFKKLLSAFKQDSVYREYKSFEELLDYSDRSANPIGHLVLNVFGYGKNENEKLFSLSDKICTALQLINFWQDVSVDLKMNRIYIPADIMNEFGYDIVKLKNKTEDESFRKVIKNLTDKTENLFDEGIDISGMLKGRLKFEIKATVNGGRKILSKIREINYNVLSTRVTLSKTDKLKIITDSFF
ncbi:MAG TPA: squalene synthase HpnC [Ignavibacteria bacterium]|nr:squalene synthase HpnC [Bacteroidota bacterium]HRI85317.1 squalene synthase HpnC [Ignavibacteria bacterium]HRJ98127.1 squalene synthase HpnC [Ignavibacteria bacterium]